MMLTQRHTRNRPTPGDTIFALFIFATLSTLMAACSDSRCSIANCKTMLDSCAVQFAAEPNNGRCFRIDGGIPADFDFTRYCPAACVAQEAGATAQCIVDNKPTCDSAGLAAYLEVGKVCRSERPSEATCAKKCLAERTACEETCTTATFESCMNCSATCGLNWATCNKACPKS